MLLRIASYGRSDDLPPLVGGVAPKPPFLVVEMGAKEVRKTVRFSKEEAEKLELLAQGKGITVSELIRRAVLNLPIPERISSERLAKKSEIFRRYLAEINKIGTNINQIARYCNQYREVDVLVLEKLTELEGELSQLLDKLYSELTDDCQSSDGKK